LRRAERRFLFLPLHSDCGLAPPDTIRENRAVPLEGFIMLVLTRRVGESIVIANDIRVTVVSIGNGRVKIGIEAPNGVSIDRSEIHERKLQEHGEAHVVESTSDSGLHNRIASVLKPR